MINIFEGFSTINSTIISISAKYRANRQAWQTEAPWADKASPTAIQHPETTTQIQHLTQITKITTEIIPLLKLGTTTALRGITRPEPTTNLPARAETSPVWWSAAALQVVLALVPSASPQETRLDSALLSKFFFIFPRTTSNIWIVYYKKFYKILLKSCNTSHIFKVLIYMIKNGFLQYKWTKKFGS